ncbi:TetR/AcrR family transcriptional regulator [Alkalimarinus coralli]|uniref:TetR/AcrR family transcriptional regulator n=1 Tax=Alkalimarinus coralli TaxID=2935863 RepID=UPI00202AFBE8|nr:TetR/AcrR family transcriptional regulator [Alkalimarinus coralli]
MAEKQIKNKEQTKTRILEAVEHILSKDGYRGLGINNVAKQAGVGKALIYRYFGGLEGVIEAYGETDAFWPSAREIRGMSREDFSALSLRDRCKCIFRNFRSALEKRPNTVAIYAWEMAEKNDAAKKLIAERTQSSLDVVKQMLGQHKKVYSEYDHEIIALLGAALLHLTIREHMESPFAGLELKEEDTWDRIEGALDTLFTGLEAAYRNKAK